MVKVKRKYIQCPMCGWVRPITGWPRKFRFDMIDTDKILVVQIREMGGRGSGFKIVEGQHLDELDDDLKEQIKTQCVKILNKLGYEVKLVRKA